MDMYPTRDQGVPQFTTLRGDDPFESSFGLGKAMVSMAVLSDPMTRMLGFEFGLPGARRARINNKGKTGFFNRAKQTYGVAGGFFMTPDFYSATELSAPGRLYDYKRGAGPIFDKPGVLGFLSGPTDFVNRLFLGDLTNHSEGAVMSAYKKVNKGLAPGAGFRERRAHYKNVSKNPSRLVNYKKMRDTKGRFVGNNAAKRKAASEAHRGLYKTVADFELRSMTFAAAGKAVAAVGAVTTALWVADIIGGIAQAAHDYGSASMKAKQEAPRLINTPTGASLRMKAMQNAAMSFGAVRAAIGNEAMSNHRY